MATKKLQILNSLVSHDTLTNLDAADQHPIEAVTGLKEALGGKADLVDGKLSVEQLSEATSLQLGGVKVGSNLSVTTDGTLSANIPSTWDWQFIDGKPSLYTQSEVDTKLNNKQTNNLVTSISEISTDVQYPSAKAVYDQLATKQDTLNLDSTPTANSSNPVTSGGVKTALDGIVKIAEGKCTTYVFDYYDTLYDTLVGENQDTDFLSELNAGDIFLIRDLKVPDYWWEPQGTILMLAAQEYGDIIVDGYGAARVLETSKIDLTDYALTSDIPTNLSQLTADATHRLVTDTEKTSWNAKSNFSGSYNDLSNKPTIPTIPSSLPANGGNADTVDSKHIVVSSSAPTTNDTSIITFVV